MATIYDIAEKTGFSASTVARALNGKGYPFGKTAAELNEPERIMACIDIYQALTEDRPYKKGLSHEKTCEMLDDMAQKGFVDFDISKKIRECFGGI